jgi:hypothetical protein
MAKLNVGDLIVDNHGRKGIVAERATKPPTSWLRAQTDTRMRTARGPWWDVFPLDEGAVLVPDSLARKLRRATVDDVAALLDSEDTDDGSATLRHLFANIRAGNRGSRRRKSSRKK